LAATLLPHEYFPTCWKACNFCSILHAKIACNNCTWNHGFKYELSTANVSQQTLSATATAWTSFALTHLLLCYCTCHHFSCVNFPVLLQWCQICTNTQSWVSECQLYARQPSCQFWCLCNFSLSSDGQTCIKLTTWSSNRHLWLLRSPRMSVFIRIPYTKFEVPRPSSS